MATPTPMKHAASHQGKTPSQSQHGVAATPPVSTPFSVPANNAVFSPHGPRSSPQTVRKSPATSTTVMGHAQNAALNYESPAAATAYNMLGIGNLDLALDNALGGLGNVHKVDDDERARRLQSVIELLDVSFTRHMIRNKRRLTRPDSRAKV